MWPILEPIVRDSGLFLHGSCSSYYCKQLAQHAAMTVPTGLTAYQLHRGRLSGVPQNEIHPVPLASDPEPKLCRVAITACGVVQGVGFCPFVCRAARERGLGGWVQNETDAVRMEVYGPAAGVAEFIEVLATQRPEQVRIESVDIVELPPGAASDLDRGAVFEIRFSRQEGYLLPHDPGRSRPLAMPAATKSAIPAAAALPLSIHQLHELRAARWSIIRKLPYDRPRTSMASFPMCAACQAEYDDQGDRRFHAQPIACPHCGPKLRLLDAQGRQQAEGDRGIAGGRERREPGPGRGGPRTRRFSTSRRCDQRGGGRSFA